MPQRDPLQVALEMARKSLDQQEIGVRQLFRLRSPKATMARRQRLRRELGRGMPEPTVMPPSDALSEGDMDLIIRQARRRRP